MTVLDDLLGGRYRLTSLLARGGMSEVYQAVDEESGTSVAVKLVRPGDAGHARRLAQEVRALERFEHPSLVRMLDSGVSGDQAYLVMDLVDGPNLAEVLRRGPLSPAATARLGSSVSDALAYVHDHGVVHRDVKPGNVLICADGAARLGDFGIARLVDASTLTVAGTTLGTAAYMAPEQLENHQVGPAADIWSLGIVLLECLTGRRIYEGSPNEVIARRLARPVPLPSNLPIPWKLLSSGMLDHRPDQRLSAAQVASLLSSPAFAEPWDPWGPPAGEGAGAGVAHDLTALAPADGPETTHVLAGGGLTEGDAAAATAVGERPAATAVLPPVEAAPPGPPGWRGRRTRSRRWLAAAAGTVLVAAVVALLVAAFASSPHTHDTASTTVPTTAHVAVSTPTTVPPTTAAPAPTGATALGALVRDVAAGEESGSISGGSGNAITSPASNAVTDAARGRTSQVVSDLQAAAAALANGVQNGSISPPEQATLQGDLSALATALRVGPAALAPPAPGPGPGTGHGKHHGGKG